MAWKCNWNYISIQNKITHLLRSQRHKEANRTKVGVGTVRREPVGPVMK